MQTFTRWFIVWVILDFVAVPKAQFSWAFVSMTMAWTSIEVVRYSYYVLHLLDGAPTWLTWSRYSFFYLLYPIGALSEAYLVYLSLDQIYESLGWGFYYTAMLIVYAYPPGTPLLLYNRGWC